MRTIATSGRACLEAWIQCENLLAGMATASPQAAPTPLEHVVNECAHICMETWQALKEGSHHSQSLMLLCIGICEECAEHCEVQNNAWCRQCAKACRYCANNFSQFAKASLYN